ncbi:MAG TPA: TonB-dependent receptor [Cryomorphaceae bacterium]|nr:TonB-dependent receptor [Cryomorphaceae bacterium]
MRLIIALSAFLAATSIFGQSGILKGRVIDEFTNEVVPFSNVALQETNYGAVSDIDGNYEITGIEPGLYNVQASFVGYKTKTIFEVEIFAAKPTILNIPLEAGATNLEAVEITTEVFERNAESPVSLQQIGTNEIQRNPGGNRDISRALQILPGVASSLSFRNDIIIRGGAPNENRFFLDGIEVPVINHFATQGSSGGPVGILNVNFIQNVDFYSGAFPANRGNAMSAVLEFTQKDGNTEGLKGNFTLSATDVGLTLDGPLGEKTTFIASARRSYLQFLFGVIGLPFLPTYNDAQFKVKHRINEKNEITFIGLGALDQFELNESAAQDAETEEEKQEINYILGNLPVNNQWNYTVGANYKHFSEKGFQNVVLSRSHLNNQAEKYEQNIESPENLILNYESEEIENKFRLEHTQRTNGWRLNAGFNLEDVTYSNSTFNQISVDTSVQTVDFNSEINFQRFGFFGSVNRSFLEERLLLSFGLRSDWNNWAESMSNPIDQFSPRFSFSYSITPEFSFQGNIGRYYQLPPYTVMGFRDNEGDLVNRENGVTYIQSDHYVAGFQYVFPGNTKVSVEGFYKDYADYPFTTRDSINLANLGADFGVIGNEPVLSTGEGRSYGLEFLIQRKLYNGLFGIAALTLVRSEFTDKNGDYVPSAWDNQFILSLTAGKKFAKNWEVGTRVQVLGGPPFTPVDAETSSLIPVWNVNNRGIPDYNRLNEERAPVSYQVDFRIDKKYFFEKWSLNLYIDVENITNAVVELEPFIDVVRDDNDQPVVDPGDDSRYLLTSIPNQSGTLLPSIGVVVEF